LDGLKKKILAWKQQLLPKHPMAEALNLTFLGQLGRTERCSVPTAPCPSTTTVSEREMTRVVLNRKKSLFVGNAAEAAQRRSWPV